MSNDIEVDELAARLGEVPILDVRSAHEFDGSFGKPCDPRQGHVPGAVHLDLYRMLELAPPDVGALLGLEAGAEVVAYCHSGSRSAVAVQALRALGYDARNYVGSWHEWSRLEHLPVES